MKNLEEEIQRLYGIQDVIEDKLITLNDNFNKLQEHVGIIPNKESEKYKNQIIRCRDLESELDEVDKIAKIERQFLEELKKKLENIKAAHKAKKFYDDYVVDDINDLNKIMTKQDSDINSIFEELKHCSSTTEHGKSCLDKINKLLDDLDKIQDLIGNKLENAKDISLEYYKLVNNIPDKNT